MDQAKRDSVKAWLVKAQHDLGAARKLSAEPDSYLDTARYIIANKPLKKRSKPFSFFMSNGLRKRMI